MASGGWGGAAGAWTTTTTAPEDVDLEEQPPAGNAYATRNNNDANNNNNPAFENFNNASKQRTSNNTFETEAPSGATASREADLRRREAAVSAKEKELSAKEARLNQAGQNTDLPNNWPVCYPIVHHDIPGDIPEGNLRRVVREAYLVWWGLVVCLLWNFICASAMLGMPVGDKVSSWFLAVIYALVGIPLSFFIWYRGLYQAASNDSSVRMVFFFLNFAIHCGFCTWAAIAIPFSAEYWSFAGFGTSIKAIDVNTGVGTIYFIGAALWTLEALCSYWVIADTFYVFKGKGGIQEQRAREAALPGSTAQA